MALRLLSIDNLSSSDLTSILSRASELAAGAGPVQSRHSAAVVFFEASLRTRTGFQAAAQRLGWPTPVVLSERRSSEVSMVESVADTFAVLGAYFDVLLVRFDKPIAGIVPHLSGTTSLVNCGDRGPCAEHPTQALIDVFAMTELVGDLSDLHVALVGDLRMRSSRSLMKLFVRIRPGKLTLISDDSLTCDLVLPRGLGPYELVSSFGEAHEIDAVVAVGIPHLGAPERVRGRLRVDLKALEKLSGRGRVFAPMPVIDEVAQSVRTDARVAFLEQNARAQCIRIAVLESLT